MRKIGYVRVSSQDQNEERQIKTTVKVNIKIDVGGNMVESNTSRLKIIQLDRENFELLIKDRAQMEKI